MVLHNLQLPEFFASTPLSTSSRVLPQHSGSGSYITPQNSAGGN